MNQLTQYAILSKTITYNDLPALRMMQYARAALNIQAGLELGISYEESAQMAAEDFATPAEILIEAQLREFDREVRSMEDYEIAELSQMLRWMR